MGHVELKRCIVCGRVKAVTEFYRDKGNKDGLRGDCKECRAAYDRDYRAAHREEINTYQRVYYTEHPEKARAADRSWAKNNPEKINAKTRRYRARIAGATIGPIDYGAIKVRDRMICCVCGKRVAEKDLSYDHTVPLSLGGPHIQENLRVCHRRCNKQRGAGRLPVQQVLALETWMAR